MNNVDEITKSVVKDDEYACMLADGIIFEPDENFMKRLIFYRNEIEIKDGEITTSKKNLIFEVRLPTSALMNIFSIGTKYDLISNLRRQFKEKGANTPELYNAFGVHFSKLQKLRFDTENPEEHDEELEKSELYMMEKLNQITTKQDENQNE